MSEIKTAHTHPIRAAPADIRIPSLPCFPPEPIQADKTKRKGNNKKGGGRIISCRCRSLLWFSPPSHAPSSSRHHRAVAHYSMLHLRFFFLRPTPTPGPLPLAPPPPAAACVSRLRRSLATTVRRARSKISSTPVISLELHSMYWAPIFCATASPCSVVTGVRP